jgi:hypothetical protein
MSAFDAILAENVSLSEQVESLQESLSDFAMRTADVDWQSMSTTGDWDLASCKTVSEVLRELVQTNPLMARGVELRQAYVYGDGYNIRGTKRALDGKMALPVNQQSFFNSQAQWQRINTRAYSGNLFYLKNKSTGVIVHVPINEIESVLTGDVDKSVVLFVRRKWSDAAGKDVQKWYVTQWNTDAKTQKISSGNSGGYQLDKDWTMFHFAFNKPTGSAIGVPDALAAMKWADAYAEYLTNQSKLVRSYSRIAFKVQSKTVKGSQSVATAVANQQSTNTYGATAVGDITALPATGSKVDFNTGRPLAAMVASVFGVGLDALLSGTVGASKSVSDTLDLATTHLMKLLQADEKYVIDTMLVSFGSKDASIDFPSMDSDPIYRRMQSLAQAVSMGWLHREEARSMVLDWLDISVESAGLPEPDGFNAWVPPQSDEAVDAVPRQGHSGSVGTQVGTNKDARDNGEYE